MAAIQRRRRHPARGEPTLYSSGDLYLEITSVTNGTANLILHGTTSGPPYAIMSRQKLLPQRPWDAEQQLIGADGQIDPIHIPTFGRQVLFFRALVGSATPQRLYLYSLGLSQNCFNLVLHGTTENTSYDLLSTPALQATNNWAVETTSSALPANTGPLYPSRCLAAPACSCRPALG